MLELFCVCWAWAGGWTFAFDMISCMSVLGSGLGSYVGNCLCLPPRAVQFWGGSEAGRRARQGGFQRLVATGIEHKGHKGPYRYTALRCLGVLRMC